MFVRVRSFAGFRYIIGKERDLELAKGESVEDLLVALCAAHADLRPMLFSELGLKEDVNIFVAGKNIASLQGIKTKIADGDEVALFPAAIGG
jgi:molybdopterin synthase sulfur carrier subunit